jgi:hypothetical protein
MTSISRARDVGFLADADGRGLGRRHALLLLLLLLLDNSGRDALARGHDRRAVTGGERDDGEVVAVAELDHEAVGVVEEDLVHVDAALLHAPLHVRDARLLEPPLRRRHALALHSIVYFQLSKYVYTVQLIKLIFDAKIK